MDIIEAYKYVKPFIFSGKKITPSEEYFKFILYINKKSYIYLSQENNGGILKRAYNINKKILIEKNISEVVHLPGFELDLFVDSINEVFEINPELIFTSEGFINIDTFYLAKDIYESYDFFKKRDIKENYRYKTISGLELIYINDRHELFSDQFIRIEKKIIYNRASFKIIEDLGMATAQELKLIKEFL